MFYCTLDFFFVILTEQNHLESIIVRLSLPRTIRKVDLTFFRVLTEQKCLATDWDYIKFVCAPRPAESVMDTQKTLLSVAIANLRKWYILTNTMTELLFDHLVLLL